MKHIALALGLLLAFTGCKKKDEGAKVDDKAAPAADDKAGDKADVADVDCEKMTTHSVAVILKDASVGKSEAEVKTLSDGMAAQHAVMVKACDDEKGTKKLTHKQYDCILASQSTAELTACVTPK